MKTLIIDAGHGGNDNGANAFGYYEKDLTLVIAKRVRDLLKEYNPDMTRTADVNINSTQRTNLIRDKYKYCLSIHLNAFSGDVRGVETIHALNSAKGKELAISVANSLHDTIDIPVRRVFEREGNNGNYYYMHRNTGSTTTVIVECLFLDNVEDIKYLNVEKIAQGIAKGFKKFMKGENPEIEGSGNLKYTRVLRVGSRGNDVKDLQAKLTKLGFDTKGVDGIFGRNTQTAVRALQLLAIKNGANIQPSGVVGRNTILAINNYKDKAHINRYQVLRPDAQTTVVRVPRENIDEIKVIIAENSSKSETLQTMKNRAKVDLIINGGLFFWSSKYKSNYPLNLLVKNNATVVSGTYSRFSLMTDTKKNYSFDWYNWNPNRKDAIGGSPALVVDGEVNLDKGTLSNEIHNLRHPRSAIGMNEEYFYMVVIDGRKPSARLYGMTNLELATYMKDELKCENALGFDGGLSSTVIGDKVLNKSYTARGLHNAVGIILKQK